MAVKRIRSHVTNVQLEQLWKLLPEKEKMNHEYYEGPTPHNIYFDSETAELKDSEKYPGRKYLGFDDEGRYHGFELFSLEHSLDDVLSREGLLSQPFILRGDVKIITLSRGQLYASKFHIYKTVAEIETVVAPKDSEACRKAKELAERAGLKNAQWYSLDIDASYDIADAS